MDRLDNIGRNLSGAERIEARAQVSATIDRMRAGATEMLANFDRIAEAAVNGLDDRNFGGAADRADTIARIKRTLETNVASLMDASFADALFSRMGI